MFAPVHFVCAWGREQTRHRCTQRASFFWKLQKKNLLLKALICFFSSSVLAWVGSLLCHPLQQSPPITWIESSINTRTLGCGMNKNQLLEEIQQNPLIISLGTSLQKPKRFWIFFRKLLVTLLHTLLNINLNENLGSKKSSSGSISGCLKSIVRRTWEVERKIG